MLIATARLDDLLVSLRPSRRVPQCSVERGGAIFRVEKDEERRMRGGGRNKKKSPAK